MLEASPIAEPHSFLKRKNDRTGGLQERSLGGPHFRELPAVCPDQERPLLVLTCAHLYTRALPCLLLLSLSPKDLGCQPLGTVHTLPELRLHQKQKQQRRHRINSNIGPPQKT